MIFHVQRKPYPPHAEAGSAMIEDGDNYGMVPLHVAMDGTLSRQAHRLLIVISRHAGRDGWCTAWHVTLGKEANIPDLADVSHAAKELITRGHIQARAGMKDSRCRDYQVVQDSEYEDWVKSLGGAPKYRKRKKRKKLVYAPNKKLGDAPNEKGKIVVGVYQTEVRPFRKDHRSQIDVTPCNAARTASPLNGGSARGSTKKEDAHQDKRDSDAWGQTLDATVELIERLDGVG